MNDASNNCSVRDHVIDAATTLFWRHGYDGVSVGDLVEATGANRYALYHEFGDKRGVYLAVLQCYIDDATAMIGELLKRPDADPIDAIRDAIVFKMLDPEMFPAGCLMCTTAVDMAARDEDVAAIMNQCTDKIGDAFAGSYAAAQAAGTVSTDITPTAFAELAHALYFSTGLQARMGRSREDLLAALESVCDALRLKSKA
ncbi:MAG: TetR/AcrR family transcriptional regulator [Pseudomonadota bacterium]